MLSTDETPPTLWVEGRQFGRNRALFPDWSFPIPPEWASPDALASLTLRALITQIVREEVRTFQERRAQRRFLQVLTGPEIAEGVVRGKIDMGGREEEPEADVEQAVAAALLAFEDGLYYVFADSEHRQNLDDVIRLRTESRVMFLRLVALAGG